VLAVVRLPVIQQPSFFPADMKLGCVTPFTKRPGLDKSDMSNFGPITNLNALAKVLEKLVLNHLRPHSFRRQHTTTFYRTSLVL